ncbi:PEPxxWA-CTERM sorting domain-containing protein [Duganella flavida]|nr:PEPxxWA-CTERM sorting domain-containing protein [Duganella flavida]
MKGLKKAGLALALIAPLQVFAADTVNWTKWDNASTGQFMFGMTNVTVTYTGETFGMDTSAYIYDVPSSFTNAEVTNTPGSNGTILMSGGGPYVVNNFHFSSPVTNPYLDMFSVGQGGVPVSFVFQNGSFTILAQGSGHWGGGTLTQSGMTVTGVEGNGLLKFSGTYTDISFITPNGEYYYGATVGGMVSGVPEPATYAMLLAGLGLTGALARRKNKQQ